MPNTRCGYDFKECRQNYANRKYTNEKNNEEVEV